jgi:hypothetical protein
MHAGSAIQSRKVRPAGTGSTYRSSGTCVKPVPPASIASQSDDFLREGRR